MSSKTAIEWTDFSSNPIKFARRSDKKRGWACVKVSPGCVHCYAERRNGWLGTQQPFSVAGMGEMMPYLDLKELNWLLKSKKISGKRVFIEDMSDLFGEWVDFGWIDQLMAVFAMRPDVTFQVLTKRAERMAEYFTADGVDVRIEAAGDDLCGGAGWCFPEFKWPLPNVWLGVSVENQRYAEERIPKLLATPAAVRFLSCEPLLGQVNLSQWIPHFEVTNGARSDSPIDWVIVGGESGPDARPMHPDWARSIRDQCRMGPPVPFLFKQWGEFAPVDHLAWITDKTTFTHRPVEMGGVMMARVGKAMAGRVLDGRIWEEMP